MDTRSCTCNTSPDADLLGFGVRLGAYMQAGAAVVGLHLRPEEAPQEAWMQVFTVAPILALSFKYALEQAVSNALFLSTTYLAFSQMITLGPGLWLPTPFGHLLLAWLIVGVLLYTFGLILWFWAAGYKRCCDGSVVYAFIGMRVEAFGGWFRPFAIAVSSAMVLAVPLLITAMFALKQALELGQGQGRQGSTWRSFVLWSGRHRKLYDGTGRVSKALFVVPLLAFSIAGTELTLRWNDIAGVYSLAGTGQLVPLLVGVGALLKAVYFALAERHHKDAGPGRAPPV